MRVLVFLIVAALFLGWLGFAVGPNNRRAAAVFFTLSAAALLLAAGGFYGWF